MAIIQRYFAKFGSNYCEKLDRFVQGILKGKTSSTGEIAHQIAKDTKVDFKTADMFIYRFLKDKNFQVDDTNFRCYINMIFDFLREKHGLKDGDNIYINVDYTTNKDNFLILEASIIIAQKKGIMLFFTTRLYPKKKNQMDQKKMELAFFKGLKHVLSKKYTYTIVADRGLGNSRIIQICEKLGFHYILRTNSNLKIKIEGQKAENLRDYKGKNASFEAYVQSWKRNVQIDIQTENNETWYILTDLKNKGIADIYSRRFKIEKVFQDMKTSGYDIEKTKIRKYDRFKRLLFVLSIAHTIATFLGFFVKYCKKNFKNHWEGLIAYSHTVDWP
jgi:hypothetical protein